MCKVVAEFAGLGGEGVGVGVGDGDGDGSGAGVADGAGEVVAVGDAGTVEADAGTVEADGKEVGVSSSVGWGDGTRVGEAAAGDGVVGPVTLTSSMLQHATIGLVGEYEVVMTIERPMTESLPESLTVLSLIGGIFPSICPHL